MEAQLIRRPAAATCCTLLSNSTSSATANRLLVVRTTTPTANTRQKSTAARARRALAIPPHPSFLGSPTSSSDRIIFNPPASEASVFHTPYKFLPKSDPRRRVSLPDMFGSATTTKAGTSTTTPSLDASKLPVVKKWAFNTKPHHLTLEDVHEIRRLRAEDPVENTVAKVASRYNCTKLFVMMCSESSREHRDKMRAELEAKRARWGPIRAAAKAARKQRFDMLMRGEL
ncbi:mitochondrial ribosomal protein subunit L20-domain-containing protein [Apodospora peruviana]|uniref:Mitochondrial ribosomal protein subunit L20-domain-containing protein n=1 Tax=Apodospora peruviana TaxID=516989 RepID=A0AAE0IJL5_9PEZI|nr:mitochondrial ribosomal protein subunit L20-domain-containing protein [Apodospora peruviana]